MSLEFVFPPMFGFTIQDKKSLEKISRLVIGEFQETCEKISGKKILMIAYGLPFIDFPNGETTGRFYDLSIPWHPCELNSLYEKFSFTIDIADASFVIVVAGDIIESGSSIYKIFTIAHEFQHLSQRVTSRDALSKCIVLYRYFAENKKSDLYPYSLPHDIDAQRKAKWINYSHNTREAVDEYIAKKIEDEKEENDYWH